VAQYRRKKGRDIDGILVLDKPTGMSSNACLQQVKHLFEAEKAGHTGSLDPLATGVLPLCFGEATKLSQFLLESDKRYRTTLRLGERTDTADAQGRVIEQRCAAHVTEAAIREAIPAFVGDIEQTPPMYSALKHQGQPLYKLARSGREVEREARPVTVYAMTLLGFDAAAATADLEIHCSKGTYVRTLVEDLGEALGCGAHVQALRRLQAGAFGESQCVTMAALAQLKAQGGLAALDRWLVAPDQAVLELPEARVSTDMAIWLKQGQAVQVRQLPTSGLVRLYDGDAFMGIGTILEDGRVAPKRLFATGS
jgi:tRNA pseudouridine55 synthase